LAAEMKVYRGALHTRHNRRQSRGSCTAEPHYKPVKWGLRQMQFQRLQEGPQTGDGKSSGRCTKRAAAKAAAVAGSGRRRNRRTLPRHGGYEEAAATAGSGRRLKRRALQEAGGGRDGDRYTNVALRQEVPTG
jgi:hypothetical protein